MADETLNERVAGLAFGLGALAKGLAALGGIHDGDAHALLAPGAGRAAAQAWPSGRRTIS